VRVYNLRGELVRVLHTGEFQKQEFTWNGTDQSGASVSSGVYVVRAEAAGRRFNAKVALVK
jgi:flagellar hook assembly protein FlgD